MAHMAHDPHGTQLTRLPVLAPRLSAVPTFFLTPGQQVLKKPLAEMITTPSGDRTRLLIPLGCTQSILYPQHQATLLNVSDSTVRYCERLYDERQRSSI